MGRQRSGLKNAESEVQRGKWKHVLDGQLVEGAPPEDAVHLSDVEADMGERANLNEQQPAIVDELANGVLSWQAGIEDRWRREWLPMTGGTTTH